MLLGVREVIHKAVLGLFKKELPNVWKRVPVTTPDANPCKADLLLKKKYITPHAFMFTLAVA